MFSNKHDEEVRRPPQRNDPCLCGSGKKYKKCCLPLQEERRRWDPLEDQVRSLIQEFVHSERFDEELKKASSLFGFEEEKAGLADGRLFYDWYIHDHVTSEGQSLIGLLEKEGMAESVQDKDTIRTLGGWTSSTFSFLEVLEVKRGTGFRVIDMFRGSQCFIWDVSGSYALSKFDILFSRPYPVGRIVRLASGSIVLPQRSKSKVEAYIKASHQDFRARNNAGTIDDYLRRESLSIIKYLKTAFKGERTVVTSEGDLILFSSCEYTLSDPELAVRLLDSSDEFVDVGEEDGALRYDWVRKAGEQDLGGEIGDAASTHDERLKLQTYLTDKESGETFTVLGNLSLRGNKLGLSCTSDRRLQSCKALTTKLLGRLIVERSADKYVEPAALEGSAGYEKYEEDFPPEVESKIAERFLDEYYTKWLHTKVPGLGNVTPLEASKTAEGRRKLEEILKIAENEAEKSGGKLKPPIAKIRAILGL